MRYFIVAGEASGDAHAARLVEALRQKDAEAVFAFVGGDLLQTATGVSPVAHYKNLAYMGFLQVFLHARTISRIAKQVQKALEDFKPDVVVPVDYPGFNFRYILPFVRERFPKTKICYYIAPKVWAWKKKRISMLRSHTDAVLCILPFEKAYFEKENLPQAVYVGNPSQEAIDSFLAKRGGFQSWDERDKINRKPVMAILCGSRSDEIRQNLPIMLKAAKRIEDGCHLLIAGAPGQDEDVYRSISGTEGIPILFGATYEILSRSHIALVTSGTATLEAALMGTPQLVCYAHRASYLSNFVFSHFFSCPFFSLVNLIAGKEVVPELLGGKLSAKRLRKEAQTLLKVPSHRQEMLDGYAVVREKVGQHETAENAAQAILRCCRSEKPEF